METTNKELIEQTLNEGTTLVINWGVTEKLTKEEKQLMLLFLYHSYGSQISVGGEEIWAIDCMTFDDLINYNKTVGFEHVLDCKTKIITTFLSLQEKGLVDVEEDAILLSLSPIRYNN